MPIEFWSTDTKAWKRKFKEINQCQLKSVSACFKKYMKDQVFFETARDTLRNAILAPQNFVAISSSKCNNCEYAKAETLVPLVPYGNCAGL